MSKPGPLSAWYSRRMASSYVRQSTIVSKRAVRVAASSALAGACAAVEVECSTCVVMTVSRSPGLGLDASPEGGGATLVHNQRGRPGGPTGHLPH